jgi:hypothetical protein
MHIYMHTYRHLRARARTHTHTHTHTHTCSPHLRTRTSTCTHTHTHNQTPHIFVHTCTHIQKYTCTRKHIHNYAQARVLLIFTGQTEQALSLRQNNWQGSGTVSMYMTGIRTILLPNEKFLLGPVFLMFIIY